MILWLERQSLDTGGEAMPGENRTVDYLICRNCSSPCYVYEMEGEVVIEALCQTCGNDDVAEFLREDEEE